LVAIESTSRSGTIETTVVVFDISSGEQIGELWDGDDVTIALQSFSPVAGDPRLLGSSSKSGYARPLIWDPLTDKRIDLITSDLEGEIYPWGWSADGKRILLCQLYQAHFQIYIYEIVQQRLVKLNHPKGVFSAGYFVGDDEIWVNWENAVAPSRLVALDAQTGQLKRIILDAGEIPAARPWRSILFSGANDDTIQAWVATPEGEGPFPTILHTHGGPTAVMSENFAPNAQAWLDHGFAFISVNYHGSTTFGKAFEKSIWGNLGDLEIDDMVAAYNWLVENNIADPRAVLLTGRSYGGYLTLQALGRRPELWAGGMAMVAIADWGLMYEDQIETLRSYQRALFGGTPAEVPEATRKSSPITYIDAIQAPILVIQGESDTRCPARQMHVFEEKLTSLGKPIDVHWFNAGHGSWVQEEAIKHQEMMMRFAYRILG
jgi:dipeptidyl aminopeptidase/acylaminoacyl peptidase